MLPLDHLLVLDLTAFRAGPTAVRQLADWGARVITIERPAADGGEGLLGARLGSDFQNLRRNNESLTLDLKQPDGKAVFLDLVRRADVVVENFAPGVTARLGLDWPSLQAVNPAWSTAASRVTARRGRGHSGRGTTRWPRACRA